MTDSFTTRQQYIDFLIQKFSTMTENIKQIEQRCDEYGRLSEESRVAQKADFDHLKHWMMNQEWRDGVLRTAMNSVKDLIEKQDEKIAARNAEQQSIIDAFRSEIESVRKDASSLSRIEESDDSVLGKIQILEEKLVELSEKTGSPYAGDIESVLQKMAEYILNENLKNTELREQFGDLKMKLGAQYSFEATLSDIDTIRNGLSEIQSQTQTEFSHQDKFNEDVISDLNKLGTCLKELCKMQQKFETDVKQNCCAECDEMKRIRECLMNQVLTNREIQMETAAMKQEMVVQHQENDALKIKQELFNKSLSVQLKSVKDEVRVFGNDATAELSKLRVEMNQLKEQHEIHREKIETESADKQQMVDWFQTEVFNIREAFSQLGKNLNEELGMFGTGLPNPGLGREVEGMSNFSVLSSPGSPLEAASRPSEELIASQTDHHEEIVKPSETLATSGNLPTNSVSLEDTVRELVEAALIPHRQEMNMLYKKVDEMSAELIAMKKKQSKKFKGIGKLNAKILNLISTPEKEESLLDKSNN